MYTPPPTPTRARVRTAWGYREWSATNSLSTLTANRGRFSPLTTKMTEMTKMGHLGGFYARARASGGLDAESRCAWLIWSIFDLAGLRVWS